MFDVAVIGSGPGGYVAALRAALRGAKVCCIEQNFLGGTCLNVGCIPTKAMLHGSELFFNIHKPGDYGFTVSEPNVDAGAFMTRVKKVPVGLRGGVESLLKGRKVQVVRGKAKLLDKRRIEVVDADGKKETIQAKTIIVATGSRPAKPGFLPWENANLMTTDEATTAGGLPKSVLILGGGVIGCEFATVYAELGIKTTLVEMLDSLVATLDVDAAKAIAKSLKKRKVNVLTGTKLMEVKASASGLTAVLDNGQTVDAEKVLVAVGRVANTEGLGLDSVGIGLKDGIIPVDDSCRTSVENIYAIGDVAEKMQYAHLASRMGIIASDNATGHVCRDDRKIVPVGVYTHPEIASVGLSEDQAKKSGRAVRVAKFSYMASGMAQAYGETEGFVKLIAEEKTEEILGALVIGQHATDVIQEIAVAMKNELTVEEIAETIHAHPTFTEAVSEAADVWLGFPLHSM